MILLGLFLGICALFAFSRPPGWIVQPRNQVRVPLNPNRWINGYPNLKHGEPVLSQTLDQFLNTGGGTTKYWDAVKLDFCPKEELTQLTNRQKEYIKVYK